MKPTLLAIGSLVVGIAVGWYCTHREFAGEVLPIRPVDGGPSRAGKLGPLAVVINGERHNFGSLDRFAHDKHEFEIRNEGDAPLEIVLGKTTCKCTLSNLTDSTIAPGKSGTVSLEWDVKTGESMFEQSAEVMTNDPQHNPIHLTIHGTVFDTLRPEEFQFTLNDLSANESTTARMRVFAYRSTDLQVTEHSWLKPDHVDHLEISFEPLSKEEVAAKPGATAGVAILLQVKPGLPLGQISQTLRVTFNLTNHDPLEIPLMGTVVSDIGLSGPGVNTQRMLVNLGTLRAGVAAKRTVFLLVKGPYREETRLELLRSDPENDFVATLGQPLRDNPKIIRYPLTIEIPATAAPVARTAEETFARVKFAVNHPQVKDLTVMVRYVVKE